MQALLLSDTHFGCSKTTTRIWDKYWDRVIASSPEFLSLDCLILAGDVMSHETRQLRGALSFFRKRMGDKPIVWVRGNHDYWDSSLRSLHFQIEKTTKLAKDFGIHNLHDEHVFIAGALVCGWDCWYTSDPRKYTQCLSRIPGGGFNPDEIHHALSTRALDGYQRVHELLEYPNPDKAPIVCVTHMPGGYTERHIGQPESWFDFAASHADVLCYGHTHRRDDRKNEHGCRIINAGSDYNLPNHLFFEV